MGQEYLFIFNVFDFIIIAIIIFVIMIVPTILPLVTAGHCL